MFTAPALRLILRLHIVQQGIAAQTGAEDIVGHCRWEHALQDRFATAQEDAALKHVLEKPAGRTDAAECAEHAKEQLLIVIQPENAWNA